MSIRAFRWSATVLFGALASMVVACSGGGDGQGSGGTANASGGTGGTVVGSGGQNSSTGGVSTGGVSAGGVNTGGVSTGGVSTSSGGQGSSSGGQGSSSGGRGSSTGGRGSGTGGVNGSTGGSPGNGGSSASGGSVAAGGSVGSGGRQGTGGASNSGGTASGTGGKSGTTGGTTGGGGASTGGKLHVFLLFGQSNMAGYARAQDADKVKNTRIQVLGFDSCSATGRAKDQWDVAVPPLHECGVGAVGPGDWFSKTLIEKLPAGDQIALVPCALSGQALSVFAKGTDKYTWMVNRVKNAQQKGGVVDGLLFHQGESDCGNASWPDAVAKLVTDLRTDLNLGNVPFLAGELPYDSACTNHNPLVNQLPGKITNGYVVSAKDLKLDPADTQWHMHFGHDDTVEFGKRFGAKMIEVLKL